MRLLSALPIMAFVAVMTVTSCSTERLPEETVTTTDLNNPPDVKFNEIEILERINEHRISMGLAPLVDHSLVKAVAFTHTDYMIEENNISHDIWTL